MGKSILITGGARSGKSRFAEELVSGQSSALFYIATAQAFDAEMEARIAAHRARRGSEWTTVHAPLDLTAALEESDGKGPRLVDCLTLWLSNLMHAERDVNAEVEALAQACARQTSPVTFVTNEVGGGIVPENALARRYRDAAGEMNQKLAAAVDEAYLVVSGCPVRIKPFDQSTF
ncbi:MAG: bifunctional adenosylcobinamide kinase/adenosylcobinamide-phosphate guanylyltransferase [Silicimonas sp.]|nr:bifunctional adenosylcobinamide kinase/adenosylcobinamide-phosphate guanylyltransferase [Silicimonas sp.]